MVRYLKTQLNDCVIEKNKTNHKISKKEYLTITTWLITRRFESD